MGVDLKKKLPSFEGRNKSSQINTSLISLLRLYHNYSFFNNTKSNIYVASVNGIQYRLLVARRKNPSPDKPLLYLYQLSPKKVYISSLYEVDGEGYLIEKDGIIAIVKFNESKLVIEFLKEGNKRDLDRLLKNNLMLLKAVIGDVEL